MEINKDIKDSSIILVGCGKMGGALLSGWLESGFNNICVISPDISDEYVFDNVCYYKSPDDLNSYISPDIIIFAVKPQIADNVVGEYRESFCSNSGLNIGSNCVFLSIIAGKTISFFKNILGNDADIIRAMPNLPVIESCGVTVLYADNDVSTNKKNLCNNLMCSVGTTHWLSAEYDINAATAISGSGPAYLFYFMECLIDAAQELGIGRELAEKLVKETIYGSAQIACTKDGNIGELRKNVTSPNGTTEAALNMFLLDNEFQNIIKKSLVAAMKRSIELSS